jgi:peptidoglycan-associated lipoprotein
MKRTPLALILLSALLIAGCASTPTEDEAGGAPISDTYGGSGGAGALGGADSGASTMGAAGASSWTGSPLDNPDSPLSTRVIYFEFDSSEIRSEFRPVLRAHAEYLAANPTLSLTLEGHADERGSREYNIALGERRADAVKRLMVAEGAAPSQLSTVSYGEERPASLGLGEEAMSLNRRVEILY